MPADSATASTPCACARMRRASRALTQLYDDLMSPSGLRVTQYSLLRTLLRRGRSCLSDLAEALLLDRTALSRTLEPLAERGLVAITAGRDARIRVVSLTDEGARALRTAEPHWRRAQEQVANRLGAVKLDALIRTLADVEALHPDPGGRAPGEPTPPSQRTRQVRRNAPRKPQTVL